MSVAGVNSGAATWRIHRQLPHVVVLIVSYETDKMKRKHCEARPNPQFQEKPKNKMAPVSYTDPKLLHRVRLVSEVIGKQ